MRSLPHRGLLSALLLAAASLLLLAAPSRAGETAAKAALDAGEDAEAPRKEAPAGPVREPAARGPSREQSEPAKTSTQPASPNATAADKANDEPVLREDRVLEEDDDATGDLKASPESDDDEAADAADAADATDDSTDDEADDDD